MVSEPTSVVINDTSTDSLDDTTETTEDTDSVAGDTEEMKIEHDIIQQKLKLIFDNLNYIVKTGRMSSTKRNEVKNMIHVIATIMSVPYPKKSLSNRAQARVEDVMSLLNMVPHTTSNQTVLYRDAAVMCGRVLADRFRFLQDLGGPKLTCAHIPHPHAKYTAKKSDIFSIGIMDLDEQKREGMHKFLESMQRFATFRDEKVLASLGLQTPASADNEAQADNEILDHKDNDAFEAKEDVKDQSVQWSSR